MGVLDRLPVLEAGLEVAIRGLVGGRRGRGGWIGGGSKSGVGEWGGEGGLGWAKFTNAYVHNTFKP